MNAATINDRILVKRDETPDRHGRFEIPEGFRKHAQTGVVLAVGPGRLLASGQRVPPSVKPGDRVAFNRWAGDDLKDAGDGVVSMREDSIYGILEDEPCPTSSAP